MERKPKDEWLEIEQGCYDTKNVGIGVMKEIIKISPESTNRNELAW